MRTDHSAAMSEHLLIKKRQKRRRSAVLNLSTKNILSLVLLSLAAYGGFRLWVGNPTEALCGDNCESMYSLLGWVLGFFLLFAAIIAAGAVVGILVALIRRSRRHNNAGFAEKFSAATDKAQQGDRDGQDSDVK